MEAANSEESLDNTDGIVSDVVLKIVLKISELLKNNIDSLKITEIFKIALKKIKSLFLWESQWDLQGWELRT